MVLFEYEVATGLEYAKVEVVDGSVLLKELL